MSGTPRKLSQSGFYHAVVKGNDGHILFEDNSDRARFKALMREVRDECELSYHAYCLMSNHVHMLIEDPKRRLSDAMALLSRGYTEHYRNRYEHEGTLYSGRFWSEPIENDAYLLCAARYIHQNPQVAGICFASQYVWSSVQEYLKNTPLLCRTDLLMGMFGSIEEFVRFHKMQLSGLAFPGSRLRGHLTDDEALVIAHAALGADKLKDLPGMKPETRANLLCTLLDRGITAGQVARMTGLSVSTVRRARRR